jgi:urease accessory protein
MIRIEQRYFGPATHYVTLSLPIDLRTRSRLKVTLDDGRAAGLFLPRGQILRGGDLLLGSDGLVIRIEAAAETVSTVHCDDALALARACYHLGNRHVPLQINADWVRYQHDHVLDDMVRGLGLAVTVTSAPFEPEAGAYSSASHAHSHHHPASHDSDHGTNHGDNYSHGASEPHSHGTPHNDNPTSHPFITTRPTRKVP